MAWPRPSPPKPLSTQRKARIERQIRLAHSIGDPVQQVRLMVMMKPLPPK